MVPVGSCPNCDADLIAPLLDDGPTRCEIVASFMLDTEDTVTGMVYERDAGPILCTPLHHAIYERINTDPYLKPHKEHLE
jgi:hypothetical protein